MTEFAWILAATAATVTTAIAVVTLTSQIVKAAVLEEVTLRDLLRMAACVLWVSTVVFILT